MLTPLIALVLASSPPLLTSEALQARFGGVTELSADVTQVKEGKFWARPMRSKIKLQWTPKKILWEALTPVHSRVTIEGGALTITAPDGSSRTLGGASGDPRFSALIGLLEAFLALDLPRIEKDFALEYDGLALIARPRPTTAVRQFTAIRFRFDEQLELRTLELESESEKTRLSFENIARVKAARGGAQ